MFASTDQANRPEYWYWTLPVVIINVVLGIVDERLNPGTEFGALSWVTMIVFLASILPTLGVSIRRLHDIDRSGWWFLLWLQDRLNAGATSAGSAASCGATVPGG